MLIQFIDHRGHGGTRQTGAIVLDWTTGEVMMSYTVTLDVTFLNKDLLILAIPVTTQQDTTLLEVRSMKGGNVWYRCELPISWRDCSVRFLGRPCSNQGANCPTRYAKLFVPDPTLDVLGIVLKHSENQHSTTVVLSIDLFLRKCQGLMLLPEDTENYAMPTFEWDKWGPDVTRWLPDNLPREFAYRTVYGARMVAIIFDGHRDYYNALLDFNPRTVHRSAVEENGDGYKPTVQTTETEVRIGGRAIKSRLPYRLCPSRLEKRYWNMSLEANTIVGRVEKMFHFFSFLPRDPAHSGEPLPPRGL
ncbi:hypothetical protein M408DRAFT_330754 [Serendipita vermifera MAFF 305830]|uniref:Uncharacterized protein n=1 Tax=Serendipita vermifera MAFF 305830 TaxID=933852 RepID=A0A0C3B3Z4_SERVB|nr:hypothetical protein M408DRAFT_330754 [Serendipita vermifera MAFF 305830]